MTRTRQISAILALALVALLGQPALAELWYVPMIEIDSDPGGFDHIQILMPLPSVPYQFGAPAMIAFSGPDALGNPSPAAEEWMQTFENTGRDFATADGPAGGYQFLAFAIQVSGNRLIDRPFFHYQTYLGDTLVGNYDIAYTGPGELDWQILPGTWTVRSAVPPWMPGDANRDGRVDISDLTILSNGYGKAPPAGRTWTWGDGDFNRDNLLDISDLTLMSNNYGYGTADNMVPEPMTLGLLAVGVIGLIRRRKGVRS
jgi:hypothetical protein